MNPPLLTALETVALSKAVKDSAVKEARPKLTAGQYDVDFTVRLSGPVMVAPWSPATVKERVPPEVVLALLLENLNTPDRRKASKYLQRELADWKAGGELPELHETARETAEMLLHTCAVRETQTEKNGNVTAPLTVELVDRRRTRARAS